MSEPLANALAARWPELVAAVGIGTSRRPWAGVADAPVAGAADDATPDGERRCLNDLALAQAGRLAGTPADPAAGVVTPSPPDRLSDPPAKATQLLELILGQNPAGRDLQGDLIALWCTSAHAAGYHLPHRLLPTVLGGGAGVGQARDAVRLVLDERGRWLAETVGAKTFAGAGEAAIGAPGVVDAEAWEVLSLTERVEVLRGLRATDPAAGRDLVLSTWERDPARSRADLIAALETGLSMADEPFLEGALDDRAQTVREQAVRLLTTLPGSRRAQRMAARLEPLISTRRTLTRSTKIAVDDPREPDAAGLRDGLKAPGSGSKTTFWLTRIVEGAPLSLWDRYGDPDAVLKALDDRDALTPPLLAAARAQRDARWAAALLRRSFRTQDLPLLTILPRGERRAWVLAALKNELAPPGTLMAVLPGPWDEEVSRRFLDAVLKAPATNLGAARREFAVHLHPAVAAQIPARIPTGDDAKALATALANVVSYHSIAHSIQEACA